MKPASVAHLIETAVARLKRQYEEKGVLIEQDLPEKPPVHVDEDRIVQVLINLLGNALQYTPYGGEVNIAASSKNHEVHIFIQDTGIGIAPEHLPPVYPFLPRRQIAHAAGGSGIGLTIAKHLVEAHGGRI